MTIITQTSSENDEQQPTVHRLSEYSDSSDDERALFWAARGAAPSLGVVVDLTLRAYEDDRQWQIQHENYRTVSRTEMMRVLDAYAAATESMKEGCSRSADLYVEWQESGMVACVSSFQPLVSATTSVYDDKDDAIHHHPPPSLVLDELDPIRDLLDTKRSMVVPWQDMFGHEAYLNSRLTAHLIRESLLPEAERSGWSVHVRSVFVKSLDRELTKYLSRRMHDAPTPWCTLHVQHGGPSAVETGGDDGDVARGAYMRCAGDVGRGWRYSVIVSAWYNGEEYREEDCKKWVVETLSEMLTKHGEQCVCVYATDMGPEAGGGGREGEDGHEELLIRHAFVDNWTRKKLYVEKRKYDKGRNMLLFYSTPVGAYEYLC
jgi:hypothetical protein